MGRFSHLKEASTAQIWCHREVSVSDGVSRHFTLRSAEIPRSQRLPVIADSEVYIRCWSNFISGELAQIWRYRNRNEQADFSKSVGKDESGRIKWPRAVVRNDRIGLFRIRGLKLLLEAAGFRLPSYTFESSQRISPVFRLKVPPCLAFRAVSREIRHFAAQIFNIALQSEDMPQSTSRSRTVRHFFRHSIADLMRVLHCFLLLRLRIG